MILTSSRDLKEDILLLRSYHSCTHIQQYMLTNQGTRQPAGRYCSISVSTATEAVNPSAMISRQSELVPQIHRKTQT